MDNGLNGHAGADVSAPAPVSAGDNPAETATSKHSRRPRHAKDLIPVDGRQLEQARFMPVMDIAQALHRRELIVEATKQLMKEGVDFGKVGGTERPTLLQPGADKLCNLFGLVIEYETVKAIEDWNGDDHAGVPFFFYELKGRAYRTVDGTKFLMGEGTGSCNAWESKYRYRNGQRLCPNCQKPNIRKSRDGGWFCWAKTGGCGANFPEGAAAIENQNVGRILNPDLADVVNTILKMAQKRCKVSTTINATSASEFFTQDVEDVAPAAEDDPDPHGFTINTGGHPYGTRAAQEYVRDQKLAPNPPEELPTKSGEIQRAFQQVRERIGEPRFFEEMQLAGVRDPLQFRSLDKARETYKRLIHIAKLQERAA